MAKNRQTQREQKNIFESLLLSQNYPCCRIRIDNVQYI